MSYTTDYLRLNNQKLFELIRDSLSASVKQKTANILTVKDDVLFVWNFQDASVLTLNLKMGSSKTQRNGGAGDYGRYQTLLLTNTPIFTPELLVVNESCDLLAIAGPLGCLVMELPYRGVPNGTFAGGKEVIYCKNYTLDERLFAYSKLAEVRQVKWHPGSRGDNHLLVLTSDNMFRLYTIQNSIASLVRVYQIGTQPTGILPGTRLPFLAGLGETGVDFDFGLPNTPGHKLNTHEKTQWDNLEWTIYILRGDGQIFSLVIDLNEKNDPILRGPFAMYPSSEDNYGSDACAIKCFKTVPAVFAVSTTIGTIYHSILLKPNDESEFGGKKNIVKYTNYSLHPADKVLYVFESIELELGLATTDSDSAYSCPIFLHSDESNRSRYFCTHETGLHVVNVPLVDEVEKFLNSNETELNACLTSLNTKSTAEYLLCTHANTASSNVNPVLGFALFHTPTTVIAFLASGQVVTLPLITAFLPDIGEAMLDSGLIAPPLNSMLREPFDSYIRKCLKTEFNQPILKLSHDTNPTATECYELLTRATQVFREEHFKKFEHIRDEIEKRVKALQLIKNHQQNELDKVNASKQELQENAERIAERYEDIKDKQEELTKRCEKLLVLVTQKQPQPSESEENLYKELKTTEEKLQKFNRSIERVKKTHKYQELQMTNWMKQEQKQTVNLGSEQVSVIKNNLEDTMKQITEMINESKRYKLELGLN